MYNINMDDNLSQSIQDVTKQPSISFSDGPSQIGKKDHKPLITGIIGCVIGILLGGAGIFGLIKLLEKPTSCPDCNCPKNISSSGIDLDFLKLENSGENIIYSPLSIRYGLSLLSAGADGKTAEEINSVLGDAELSTYQNEADVLSLANAVFIRDSFGEYVLPEYVSTVGDKYNSEVIYDSFESSSAMDDWVSQKTFGLINSIGIEPDGELNMVLANALAIQMDWASSFESSSTNGDPFYTSGGEEIEATTMHKETSSSNISYYVDDNITTLQMPLKKTDAGVQLEFTAVMPSGDLGEYIDNITLDELNSTLDGTIPADATEAGISISIPRFKFDYALNFKNDLQSLGIQQAFTRGVADFSKMASQRLVIGQAVHKANIDFSEDGIKAAAVTAFAMVNDMAPMYELKPTEVIINRPFFFVIRDKENGAIWFTGAVYQPNLWENDATNYSL